MHSYYNTIALMHTWLIITIAVSVPNQVNIPFWYAVNSLYTDIRYKDKIRYNDS